MDNFVFVGLPGCFQVGCGMLPYCGGMEEHLLLRAGAMVSARLPMAEVSAVSETECWYPDSQAVLVESENTRPIVVTVTDAPVVGSIEGALVLETALKNSVASTFADCLGAPPLARIVGHDGISFLLQNLPLGSHPDASDLAAYEVGVSFGDALAQLHAARLSHIASLGVPVWDCESWPDLLFSRLHRAQDTGALPLALRDFFTDAFNAWPEFQPSCLHGDLAAECLYVDGDRVTAFTCFQETLIGDPAHDLAWAYAAGSGDFITGLQAAYQHRYAAHDISLWERAQVLALFQPVAWLAFCAGQADADQLAEAKELVAQVDLSDYDYPGI